MLLLHVLLKEANPLQRYFWSLHPKRIGNYKEKSSWFMTNIISIWNQFFSLIGTTMKTILLMTPVAIILREWEMESCLKLALPLLLHQPGIITRKYLGKWLMCTTAINLAVNLHFGNYNRTIGILFLDVKPQMKQMTCQL